MVEKGIRGGICHAIQRYGKANSKYMTYYDKNKESSYIEYLKFNEDFIKKASLFGFCMIKITILFI